MQNSSIYILITCIVMLALTSCGHTENDVERKLTEWDTKLSEDPYSILDSLNKINSNNFKNEIHAYHSLLLTIARDKAYVDFENDKRISRVVRYYDDQNARDNNHVRALLYLGIVRKRLGMPDSTLYLPLRRAETIFKGLRKQNPETGYMLNYFIGDTYFNNNNISLSNDYFNNALEYAKKEKDKNHTIDAYLALFWNSMHQSDMKLAKERLDSIGQYSIKDDKQFYILNAQSYFHHLQGNIEKALSYDKQQLALLEKQVGNVDISKLYYSISNKYISLHNSDSAKYYADLAISNLSQNNISELYLYYKNLADVAQMNGETELAIDYLNSSLNYYHSSVHDVLNNEIKEAERKYDLSLAENSLLKSRQTTIFWALAALSAVIMLLIATIVNRKNRANAKEKMMILRHDAAQRELETKLMREDANKMEWLISIYSYLSERLTNLQDNFEALSQRYVSSHPKVHDSMTSILHDTANDLKDMYNEIHPDDETFTQYTRLSVDESGIFNSNEKMMLMLLASKASNKQIATFMNSSLESVRTRKSQLKRKMTKEGMNIDKFF